MQTINSLFRKTPYFRMMLKTSAQFNLPPKVFFHTHNGHKCNNPNHHHGEDEIKAAAKDFMASAKNEQASFELQALSDWQPQVMESKIPVILDCYADWCAPCKKLDPILQEKMAEHVGKLKLVKLNIDNFPQLTTGLNIRSVPTLFIIFKGNIVDMMQGFQPSKLEELIQTALVLSGMETDENMMQDILNKL